MKNWSFTDVLFYWCESFTESWKVKSLIDSESFLSVKRLLCYERETGTDRMRVRLSPHHIPSCLDWTKQENAALFILQYESLFPPSVCVYVCLCSLIFLPEWTHPVLTRLSFSFNPCLHALNKHQLKDERMCVFPLESDMEGQDDIIKQQSPFKSWATSQTAKYHSKCLEKILKQHFYQGYEVLKLAFE